MTTTTTRIARPKLALAVATACSLIVVTIGLARTVFAPEPNQDTVNVEQTDTTLPGRAPAVAAPIAKPAIAVSSPTRGPIRAARVIAKPRLAPRRLGAANRAPIQRPPATSGFAGGTRGFAWALHAP